MPLADWLKRLESLSALEIDMGLDRVATVLARLDADIPAHVIHVAGTNGKGSCVAMLEALLRTTGARIGCYTSPHVHRYNERIRIDGIDADDASIVAAFEQVEAVRGDVPLTYFEYGTIAAVVAFASRGVDVAILEVGMGGRLDAVNAIEPDAGLITNVSLDHCDWLGNDVETIAMEKAGIMRPGKPVVYGARDVPESIVEHANAVGADLIVAGRDYDWSAADASWHWQGTGRRLKGLAAPALCGAHQIGNAAAVLALLEAAGHTGLLEEALVNEAFATLHLEGRMQQLSDDQRWLFDVAHNPAAAAALAEVLEAGPGTGRTVAILGLLDDKDVEGIVAPLAGTVTDWIAVTADSPRAVPADELSRQVANLTNSACLIAESPRQAADHAMAIAAAGDRILVTGSFYLVGPMLCEIYSRPTL